MWNLTYGNRKCNEFEKIRDHKMHLERLVTTKPGIDAKEPKKPSFLMFKAKKEKMEQEMNEKINYENKILLKKILCINNKPSLYHPLNLQIKTCPAFEKSGYKNYRKQIGIITENYKYKERVSSAKPHYCVNKTENDYKNNIYLNNMISKTKSNINPNLNFETPNDFIKKVEKMFFTQLYNTDVGNSNQRPSTAYQKMSNPRALSATSKVSRKIRSSKTQAKKMNIESTNQSKQIQEDNENDNNELFDEPNFDEN